MARDLLGAAAVSISKFRFLVFFTFCVACGSDDGSSHPATGGAPSSGGGGGTSGSSGTGGGGGGPWKNPGCSAPKNVVGAEIEKLALEIDLTNQAAREYRVAQTITLRSESSGDAVTLFGAALLPGEASHGYAYDGQAATFCVEPFQAGEAITLKVSYVVSEAHQKFPADNVYGIHVWGDPNGDFAVGAYSAPYFASTWMFAPHAMPWVDAAHAGTAVVRATDISVRVPDASWSVVGPGNPTTDANEWKFSISGSMPLQTLAFAASPSYREVIGTPSASGVALSARVSAASEDDVTKSLAAARDAVDWMDQNIAPFSFPTSLTFAEVFGYPGGFEHTSGVWLGSVVIDGGEQGDYVAAHETVHHWFGNDVKPASWSHFWLSEGFTEWVTVFAIHESAARQKKYRTDAALLSYPATAGAPNPGPLRFPDGDDFALQLTRNGQLFYRYGAAFLEMVDQRLKRDHASDLVSVLKSWYAKAHGSSVTTEQFRDFLIAETSDASFAKLFDEWVMKTPCPTLELANYAYANGQVSFDVRRTAGANQDLPSLEVVVAGAEPISISLPSGVDVVKAQTPVAVQPTSITIDPKGFYILKLTTEAIWAGPSAGNTLP